MEKESPSIEEPKAQEPVDDDTEALMAELKKLEIENPKQIQDMSHAAHQTGKAWNEVGQLRQQVSELSQMLNQQQQSQQVDTDYGDSVDLAKIVKEQTKLLLGKR